MPTFYNYAENGLVYSFDDVFVPADAFRSGNLLGWGQNIARQLGDNTVTNRTTPVTTFGGGANWKQVTGGYSHTAAIKTDGTLWAWGANNNGQLGDNTQVQKNTPVQIYSGGTNWKQVACGDFHTAAIKTDGTLWTWGYNLNSQLGDSTLTNRTTPVTTFGGGANWKQVACGYSHTAAIKTDGTLWAWGNNGDGQLGDNTQVQKSTPVQIYSGSTNWKQVSCGLTHTAAVKTDGTLWTWGRWEEGQLGFSNNSEFPVNGPVEVGGTDWKQVACGGGHTAAIKTDGTLLSWGNSFYGQPGTNWKQVAAGRNHTAAIKTDGTLWCWGNNNEGQLGDNTLVQKFDAVQTFLGGTNWKQVACGVFHTAAVTSIDDFEPQNFSWLLGEEDFGAQINSSNVNSSAGTFTSANIRATSSGTITLSFTFTENDVGNIEDSSSYIRLYKNSLQIFEFIRSQGLTTTYSVSYNTNDVFYFETNLSVYNGNSNPGIGTIQVDILPNLVYKYTMTSVLD